MDGPLVAAAEDQNFPACGVDLANQAARDAGGLGLQELEQVGGFVDDFLVVMGAGGGQLLDEGLFTAGGAGVLLYRLDGGGGVGLLAELAEDEGLRPA